MIVIIGLHSFGVELAANTRLDVSVCFMPLSSRVPETFHLAKLQMFDVILERGLVEY